jgi:hypothetical protein
VPGEQLTDIPPELADLVREAVSYSHPTPLPGRELSPDIVRRAQSESATNRNARYAKFHPHLVAFEARWKALQAHKSEVIAGVAEANALIKANRLLEARARLEALIAAVPADDQGHVSSRPRDILELRDVEMPAVDAYVDLVATQKDFKALAEAARLFWTRRRVGDDHDLERWYYLAVKEPAFAKLVSSSGNALQKRMAKITLQAMTIDDADNTSGNDGERMAGGFAMSLSKYGLAWTTITVDKGKPGDWITMTVTPAKVTDKAITAAQTEDWRVPTRCWKTTTVLSVDGAGNPWYEEQCEYLNKQRQITLEAKLAAPLPAWAKSRTSFPIIGKIAKSGPSWKLIEVVVPDLRYGDH